MSQQKFSLGPLLITPAAAAALPPADVHTALRRHATGDWGDLCAEDRRLNDHALWHGGRLFSSYRAAATGQAFWVITEADRSATTVLLPDDY